MYCVCIGIDRPNVWLRTGKWEFVKVKSFVLPLLFTKKQEKPKGNKHVFTKLD